MKTSRLTTPVGAMLLAFLYVVSGMLGHSSSFMNGRVALLWPPAGIALAGILLFGYRMWWGVALGAWVFTFMRGSPIGFFTVATAVGNTIGAIVCAYLLERFVAFKNPMERLAHAAGFILFACLLGTTVNATFNVIGLCYSGVIPWEKLFDNVVYGGCPTPWLCWWSLQLFWPGVPPALCGFPRAGGWKRHAAPLA